MPVEARVLFSMGEWYLLEESTNAAYGVLVIGFCFTIQVLVRWECLVWENSLS